MSVLSAKAKISFSSCFANLLFLKYRFFFRLLKNCFSASCQCQLRLVPPQAVHQMKKTHLLDKRIHLSLATSVRGLGYAQTHSHQHLKMNLVALSHIPRYVHAYMHLEPRTCATMTMTMNGGYHPRTCATHVLVRNNVLISHHINIS